MTKRLTLEEATELASSWCSISSEFQDTVESFFHANGFPFSSERVYNSLQDVEWLANRLITYDTLDLKLFGYHDYQYESRTGLNWSDDQDPEVLKDHDDFRRFHDGKKVIFQIYAKRFDDVVATYQAKLSSR